MVDLHIYVPSRVLSSPLGTPEALVHRIANPRTRALSLGGFKRDTIGNVLD